LELLADWAEGFQPSVKSLDDPQNHLIVSALPLLQQCKLTSNFRISTDARPLIYESTKVAFSTVSSAGGKSLQPFFEREPLIILDEGKSGHQSLSQISLNAHDKDNLA
jgi:hypothetical protein